jgi:thioredoxin-like negative regulator of GroEL
MTSLPIRWNSLLCVGLLALHTSALRAQETPTIKWRTDYNSARKEAEAKKLPVLIEFVRPNCPPCAKMEQYTFTDARILNTLNEKFIPLKINGVEDVQLASRLNISLFPTLVLAGPDGRIKDTLIGYQEADALHDTLQRMLASITPNDAVQKDFQNALKWEASGDYARAILAAKNILEDNKGNAIEKNARELLQKIDKRANDRLAQAKSQIDNGQKVEALESLTEILRQYPGLAASNQASDLIAKLGQANGDLKSGLRTKRVRELLAQAQDFYKSKDYIPCLDRCEVILAGYADLPESQQAFALAAEIKNNPEWLQAAADVMTDRLGGVYLALSDSYLKRGETRLAQVYLQRVIQAFPGSRMAESAQIRLTQLQGTTPEKQGGVESARP